MKYLTLEDTKKIMIKDVIGDSKIKIREDSIIDFEWGSVFFIEYNTDEEDKTIYGAPMYLIDKISGEIVILNCQENLDLQLEKYREEKGYKHVIKFPVKGNLEKMTDLEKVFALMETIEFAQIEQAIEIVKEKKLFDINGLGVICGIYRNRSLVESISEIFNHIEGEFILYEYPLKTIPKEIELFKDRITSIFVHVCKLEELPESILKLKRLKSIIIDVAPLKKMPYDLRALKELKKVVLENVLITEKEINKFKLPKGCKMEIKTMPNNDFFENHEWAFK